MVRYNKKLHIELLNQKEIGLNDESKLILKLYSVILTEQLNWEIKSQYLELLTQFVEKEIDILKFIISFCERYNCTEEIRELLESNRILLSPNKNSLEFGSLLFQISSCCDAYSGNPEPLRDKYDIDEIEFTNLIEEIYVQLKELIQE